MKRLLRCILFLLMFSYQANAQELNCRVSVNYSNLSNTPTPVFQALQKDITAFLNERKWTNHTYDINEKIECNFLITITEYNGLDRFAGTVQINLSRPVYYTSYNSPLFTFKENEGKLVFNYLEGQPLEYIENQATSNLTQVLAYYAYIILGYDYDTFSPLGGTEYFRKAFRIVLNAQSAGYEGWSASDNKQNSRYNLIDALLDKRFENLRLGEYYWHRQGLDLVPKDPESGRKKMLEALKYIQRSERAKSNSLLVSLFFTAKSDEIVNVFSASPANEKTEVMRILKEIDASNATKYEKINAGN
ncbi:MAG: DUF4835 family protein [Bacteroidales bacterium]|nr:DUF4835 family protein [Bacteroidales bacterium]MBQ5539243.1 DUF4835 family protein [Bacteroidales bacterium]MBR4677498.1 DUF4835 family protein [Bacteroidales bacterium]